VLSKKVARQALDILVHVTGSVPWYARGALIPGYMIGGKTGTAQIWDTSTGDWKAKVFNHSFIGFVGGDAPEAVIAVRLEEPKVKIFGKGLVDSKIESYELFRMVARAAIKQLDISKSKDPNAGLPIIGTAAARSITPQRNALARQRARQRTAARQGRSASAGQQKGRGRPQSASRKERKSNRAGPRTARTSGEVEP